MDCREEGLRDNSPFQQDAHARAQFQRPQLRLSPGFSIESSTKTRSHAAAGLEYQQVSAYKLDGLADIPRVESSRSLRTIWY